MTTDLKNLPKISAVYRVRHQGSVVYIGQAKNLHERWKTHHILPELIDHYKTDWDIDWVAVAPHHLNRAEAFAFRQFRPCLNKRDPSALLKHVCITEIQ